MNIASTLCWVLGILNVLGGFVLGIPAFSTGRPIGFPLMISALGVGLCYSGYGLRKRQRTAGVLAIILSVVSFISPPFVGFLLGTSIIILTVVNRKQLA